MSAKMINPKSDRIYYAHFKLLNSLFTEIEKPMARATVAMKFDGDIVYWSISWCSPWDKFSRREGRVISSERIYNSNCRMLANYPRVSSYYELAKLLLSFEMADHHNCPSWAQHCYVI